MIPTTQNAPSPNASGVVPAAGFFRWPLLLLVGFCLVAAGACLDYQFPVQCNGDLLSVQGLHTGFCYFFLLLLLFADREPETRRRLWWTAGLFAATCAAAWLMRGLVADLPHRDEIKDNKIVEMICDSPMPWLWAVALWLAAPILDWRGGARRYSRTLRVAGWALIVYGAFSFGSVAASQWPEKSLSLFYHERPLLLALLFAWLRFVHDVPERRERTGRAAVWVLGTLAAAGMLVGLADLLGGGAVRAWLVKMQWIYLETAPQTDKTSLVRRLNFPMLHFNRTAYLGLMAALACFVGAFSLRRRGGLGRWSLLGLVPAFFVMLLSGTRGVTAAVVMGLVVWAALVSRRALAAIVVVCVAALLAMPAPMRAHYLSIFKASTYNSERDNMTSIGLRVFGWKYGLRQVGAMPWTGVGYGTQVVKADYEEYIRKEHAKAKAAGQASVFGRIENDLKENATHQHMHNLWLEVAVESGLPALAALIVFTAARWALLWRAFRRSAGAGRRRVAAWVAFELSVMIAGTIFYMLKHNFGMLNFFVWGYLLSELDAAERGAGEIASGSENAAGALPAAEPALAEAGQ